MLLQHLVTTFKNKTAHSLVFVGKNYLSFSTKSSSSKFLKNSSYNHNNDYIIKSNNFLLKNYQEVSTSKLISPSSTLSSLLSSSYSPSNLSIRNFSTSSQSRSPTSSSLPQNESKLFYFICLFVFRYKCYKIQSNFSLFFLSFIEKGDFISYSIRDSIAVIRFNDVNSKVNTLNEGLLREAKEILSQVRGTELEASVKGIVLISGKPDNFITGKY